MMAEKVFEVPFLDDDFIFMPACAYNGNRFPSLMKQYPPMFTPTEASADTNTVITDVPRLHTDGSGKIEVTSGDVSVPCIGVFSASRKKGWLLFTVQEIAGKNIGLAYMGGKMILTWPSRREKIYQGFHMHENTEPCESHDMDIPSVLLTFDCSDIDEFYRVFFENRKIMGMDDTLPDTIPRDKQLKIQIEKFNSMNWREHGEFYAVGCTDNKYQVWQPGWTGGAMHTYALLKCGGRLERERSIKTLEHLFRFQGKSGLFLGGCDSDLHHYSDGFDTPGTENWSLIRKSADCLYFVLRQFALLDRVPKTFSEGIRRCSDAFVTLWKRYGQFGQFVDCETLEIVVGGSVSGGIAPAGLVLAYRYFGDEIYIKTAKAAMDFYDSNYLHRGYTTGGPGETLQCPDSESAFGLLESFVTLYDETKDHHWLDRAKACAHLASSWVVPYNYSFPKNSEFSRLGIKSIGSIFANIQNKHAAPGICTLSGTSLRKLYEWTGDSRYLTLYREITETVAQYISTKERPIHTADGGILPFGCINERVNLSDWETPSRVGEVFNGSCWSETSNLLWLADM